MKYESFEKVEEAIKRLGITFEEYMLSFNVSDEDFNARIRPA